MHILLWIERLLNARNNLSHRRKRKRQESEKIICGELDQFSSNEFLADLAKHEEYKVFTCDCENQGSRHAKSIEVASDQQLRNLRTAEGTLEDPSYVYCKDCNKKFTAEEVGYEYLTKIIGLTSLEDLQDNLTTIKELKEHYWNILTELMNVEQKLLIPAQARANADKYSVRQ